MVWDTVSWKRQFENKNEKLERFELKTLKL